MAIAYLDLVLEFMYEELAWRVYNKAYRDAAAFSNKREWFKVNKSVNLHTNFQRQSKENELLLQL